MELEGNGHRLPLLLFPDAGSTSSTARSQLVTATLQRSWAVPSACCGHGDVAMPDLCCSAVPCPAKPVVMMGNLGSAAWGCGRFADVTQTSLRWQKKTQALLGRMWVWAVVCWCSSTTSSLGSFLPETLTSSQEQKQSGDEIYCDAEGTSEINASLSSHEPSSLCFKSGTV